MVKNTPGQGRRHKRRGFSPWVGKIPWRRAWQPTPVLFLKNPMDSGSWWAIGHRVAKSWTWLKRLSTFLRLPWQIPTNWVVCILSLFWRPEVQAQGFISRAGPPLKVLGKSLLASSSFQWLQPFLSFLCLSPHHSNLCHSAWPPPVSALTLLPSVEALSRSE